MSADNAEVGDEKPKKPCQYESTYGGRPCGNEAVKAGFARVKHRVNDHGVHVTTEARIVWLCEEHENVYPSVPDQEAKVVSRRIPPEDRSETDSKEETE